MMRAIGGISDRHISEFAEVKPSAANKKAWIKYITAAACICLICISVFAVIQNRQIPAPPDDVTDRTADNYTALEVGSLSDASDGRIHKDEFPIWSSENISYHFDETAPSEATVSFMGTEYTGSYRHSYILIPGTSLRHQYKNEEAKFTINAETGKLKSIDFYREYELSSTVDIEYCQKLAESVISQYINIDDYELEIEETPYYSNYLALFRYTKIVSGYLTSDYAMISIDGNGNISSFGLGEIDAFSVKDKINVDRNVIEDAVKTKVALICGDDNEFSYEINYINLFITPEKEYAFVCDVSITIPDENGGITGCEEYFVIAPE